MKKFGDPFAHVEPMLKKSANEVIGYAGYPQGYTFSTADAAFAKFFGNPTFAGNNVTPTSAMQQIHVYTCLRIIAETIGSLPGCIQQRLPNGDLIEAPDHPLAAVLFGSPNDDMDPVEFREAKITNIGLQGNSYCWRNLRGDGEISSLYPIAADAVIPQRDNPTGRIFYKVYDRQKWETVPREKIWHVKGFGSNGLVGFSPIGYQRQMIGMALATEQFQATFFANGATPTYLFTVPNWLEDNQREQAKKNLQELWSGMANAYKAQLLEGGMTATAATMPLEDAQFLQLKASTRDDIFGMYRVPPHMGGVLDRATNNNIEQQALEFIQFCIMPYITRFEASAQKWLFQPKDRGKFFLNYDIEGLLRADSAAMAALINIFLQNGVMSRNEARRMRGMNSINKPGMDDYTVQVNLTPIGMLQKLADKSASPNAAPPAPNALKSELDTGVDDVSNVLSILRRHSGKENTK